MRKTAHFVIPGNVRHGEDLICSYLACRNAGVKFRYCAICRVPVAKRNFHQRHNHRTSTKTGAGKPNPTAAAADDSTPNNLEKIPGVGVDPKGVTDNATVDRVSQKRQLHWASLLSKRPNSDDADGMSAWLVEVLAASDPNKPPRAPKSLSKKSNDVSDDEASSDEELQRSTKRLGDKRKQQSSDETDGFNIIKKLKLHQLGKEQESREDTGRIII